MGLGGLYKKLALTSPYVEVMLRHIYWKNNKWLSRYNPNNHSSNNIDNIDKQQIDFGKIIDWMKAQGVQKGCLLVVHSSYDIISGSGLRPNDIIVKLRELIGEEGTLAMPVIRHYRERPNLAETLSENTINVVCKYDPKRTPVKTGLLPSMLMREKGAVISLHPLNTLAAIGPLAEDMMAHNLDGDKPTPHGPNSSWKYCLDHDAIIVAIGVPMIHHLTIAHVKDEAFGQPPFNDWYQDLQFDIVMPDKSIVRKTVRDRKAKWGLLHDAEMNFGKDLEKAGVMHLAEIDGVQLGFLYSKELIAFMQSQKNKAYPYYKIF